MPTPSSSALSTLAAGGLVTPKEMEAAVPDLVLATAMATSGAAASANMGRSTIKILTFSLSLLNIRLGYWLPNPARLGEFARRFVRARPNIGPWFFATETTGRLDEKTLNVYLTDGGHIENLGICCSGVARSSSPSTPRRTRI